MSGQRKGGGYSATNTIESFERMVIMQNGNNAECFTWHLHPVRCGSRGCCHMQSVQLPLVGCIPLMRTMSGGWILKLRVENRKTQAGAVRLLP